MQTELTFKGSLEDLQLMRTAVRLMQSSTMYSAIYLPSNERAKIDEMTETLDKIALRINNSIDAGFSSYTAILNGTVR